jgi:hypothetical protein
MSFPPPIKALSQPAIPLILQALRCLDDVFCKAVSRVISFFMLLNARLHSDNIAYLCLVAEDMVHYTV